MKTYTVKTPTGQRKVKAASQSEALAKAKALDEGTNVKQDLGVGDMAMKAVGNIPSSAAKFAKDMVYPVTNPLDTLGAFRDLALGLASYVLPGVELESEKSVDALAKFFADRYGSVEDLKRTIAEDPVGVLGDASTILTLGSVGAARVPGKIGQLAPVLDKAAAAIDPVRLATKVPADVAGKAAAALPGLTSGVGADVVKEAAKAGYRGGERGELFRDSMRGNRPMTDVLDDVTKAIEKMAQSKSAKYEADMRALGREPKVLDFGKIDDALDEAMNVGSFKGVSVYDDVADVQKRVADVVDEWRGMSPQTYHTAAGLDALKRRLRDVGMKQEYYGTSKKIVVDNVYKAIKKTIETEFPSYAKTMKDYETAARNLDEVKSTLSQKPNANVETKLKKIQAALRDNVYTGYGRRRAIADAIDQQVGGRIMPQIAGQATQSFTPRGLQGLTGSGTGVAGLTGMLDPATAISALTLQSPRVVGEVAHGLGRMAGQFGPRISNTVQNLPPRVRGLIGSRPARLAAHQIGRGAGAVDEEMY